MMSTLTKNKYNRLSKEELILLLEARDNERKADTGRSFAEASNIKRIISEVLVLLFNEERDREGHEFAPELFQCRLGICSYF